MTGNYLTLLEESLRRKLQILTEIQEHNQLQQEIFRTGKADIDKFDEYVAEKGSLIDKLTAIDNGFERLYEKVSAELESDKAQYADQIKTLQGLITEVTDASVAIQAQEARTKKLIEDYFQKERSGIGMNRKSSKAAIDYYKTMRKTSVVMPLLMDKKK